MARSFVPACVLLAACATALLAPPKPTAPARRLSPSRPFAPARRRAAALEDASGSVAVRPTPDRGLGVFATAAIASGTFVVDYAGEVIDADEVAARHPELEPEYAFRVGELYIDAERCDHWSKRMNHDALDPALDFEVSESPPRVRFTAIRDVAAGEELTFDYGEEYWDGRSFAPDPATDARIYAAPVRCESVDLGVPLSDASVDDVLAARAPRAEKVAALRRALDYFGVDQRAVDVPAPRLLRWLGRPSRVVDAADASPRQLARALRVCLAWD